MKFIEVIFILVFTLVAIILLISFIYLKFPKLESKEITIEDKKSLLTLLPEFYRKCLEENKNKKERRICFTIFYDGNEEIKKDEIKIDIDFEILYPKEYLQIVYEFGNVKVIKVSRLVE